MCDLAEVYHLLDLQAVPVRTLARLVFGLGDNSRTVRQMSGVEYSLDTILLAHIADSLAFIAWTHTKDAEKGRNRPQSIAQKLLHPEEHRKASAYDTPEAFMRARAQLLNEV